MYLTCSDVRPSGEAGVTNRSSTTSSRNTSPARGAPKEAGPTSALASAASGGFLDSYVEWRNGPADGPAIQSVVDESGRTVLIMRGDSTGEQDHECAEAGAAAAGGY